MIEREVTIPYQPTKIQMQLHTDKHRFKVAVFGRRSGKSTFAINEAIRVCLEKPGGKVWIITPTFNQAKDIYWRGGDMLNQYLLKEMYKKKNDSELLIEFNNGAILQFKGADRPEVMRGSALDLIILDEVSEHRYAEETWLNILLPALSDKQGSAVFIGTPKGYNFFYDLYDSCKEGDPFWKAWRIPTWDSKAPWTVLQSGKDELKRLKLEMTEDAWMQEYGADFRKHTGLIFKEFDRATHVKDFGVKDNVVIEAGMDFGWQNPTAVLLTYFDDDDTWYIFDEYYAKQRDYLDHAGRIKAMREKYRNGLKYVMGDSEDPQAIQEYSKFGWYVTPVSKTEDSVLNGINKISERLKINPVTKKPRLFVHPRCENLIYELERYKWEEQKNYDSNEKDMPSKAYDHTIDALRYVILHHNPEQRRFGLFKPILSIYKPRGGYL
jgi:phage terminase large subunit